MNKSILFIICFESFIFGEIHEEEILFVFNYNFNLHSIIC